MGQNLIILNPETAEILYEIQAGDKIKITHGDTVGNEYIPFPSTAEFIKLWDCVIPSLFNIRLTGAEMITLFCLVGHVEYQSCAAVMPNGEHVTTVDIETETGLSEISVKRAIQRLRDVGLIAVSTSAKYHTFFVNPFTFTKGHKVNATLQQMFKKTPQYEVSYQAASKNGFAVENDMIVFPDDMQFVKIWKAVFPHIINIRLTGAEVSVLMSCFGNVRYDTAQIAHSNGKPIDAEALSSISGVNIRKTKEALKKLTDNGFVREKDGMLYLNPFIACKGNRVEKAVVDLFNGDR